MKEKVYCSECRNLLITKGIPSRYECHAKENTISKEYNSWLQKSITLLCRYKPEVINGKMTASGLKK